MGSTSGRATRRRSGSVQPLSISRSALLLLADGRLPAGGHAHSGGVEAAAALEGVRDVPELAAFLRGRLSTAGAVAAAFAAASCTAARSAVGPAAALMTLDAELEARIPSPALRGVSRGLGRQLLRAARSIWPDPGLDNLAGALPHGAHHPVALGAVAAAADLGPADAALAAAHEAVAGPAAAAVRLLGLDPFAVQAALAALGPRVDAVAAEGTRHAGASGADLPAWSAPMLDVLAERHATWEVRLFAS